MVSVGTRDIGIKELRNRTSEVIDAVNDGETVFLTRRGVRVAEIRPVGGAADARRRRLIERLRTGESIADPIDADPDIDSFRATHWDR